MHRNNEKRRNLYKIHLNKRKGSITIECLALISILLVVMSIIGHITLGKIRSENNFWVSYGINNIIKVDEEKVLELHEILLSIENIDEFLKDDRYFRSNNNNTHIAKYVSNEKRFKLLNERGVESGLNFSYKVEEGCSCKLDGCEVINKGLILKFVL